MYFNTGILRLASLIQKSVMLRELHAKRGQKSMVTQVIRETPTNIS